MAQPPSANPDLLVGQPSCAGFRVIDFTRIVSGPICTQILADLGAEVIKIESGQGDVMRQGAIRHNGMAAGFEQYNRGKKSFLVDLRSEEGVREIRRLCDGADVLVENFRPGVMERIGLDYGSLRRTNPALIYMKISGFGEVGPYADRPAYDQVIQALTGFMQVQGAKGEPEAVLSPIADKITGIWAGNAILSALLHRQRNGGLGQRIGTNLLSAFSSFMLPDVLGRHSFPDADIPPLPDVDRHRPIATLDGHVCGLVLTQAQFEAICAALDRPDLLGDPRFATPPQRMTNINALRAELAKNIGRMTTMAFLERARRFDIPFDAVQSIEAFFGDPQAAATGCVVDFQDPEVGTIRHLGHPTTYERFEVDVRRRAPWLGEHSDALRAELAGDADDSPLRG